MQWESELANATKKNQAIRKVFVANDRAAKKEIALTTLSKKAQDAQTKRDYTKLLSLMEELESLDSEHELLNKYRLSANLGLAQQSLNEDQTSQALQYFQQASEYASKAQQQDIQRKVKSIQKKKSNNLFVAAMKIFKQDIAKALTLLEQAVSIDPSNARAKKQLLSGQRIQANLERIKQNQ